jgi:hypothetical protein
MVTRRQLEARGLGSKAITIRIRKGQLQLEEEPGRVIEDVARALTEEDWLPNG